MNDLNMADVTVSLIAGRSLDEGGLSRVVAVTSPLDILQVQEAVLAIAEGLGFGPQDVNTAVAAVSRMASTLLTCSGEATMSLAPAKVAVGLEVEAHGGVAKRESDRRRIEASIVRLLGHDDWTVPADGGSRVSARKTFSRRPQA